MSDINKFRRWVRFNLDYLGSPRWDTGISPPELMEFLTQASPGRALDLGCGTGTNLLTMARHGWEVTGVDLAWLSVRQARTKLRKAGFPARVIRGGVTADLGLGSGYGLVLDIGCYHNLTSSERASYRQKLMLRMQNGGTFLLYAHRRRSPEAAHGIDDRDLASLSEILTKVWQSNNDEARPGGGGGYPATWVRFDR